MENSITSFRWGTFEGEEVRVWRLRNARGLQLEFTNFGGRLIRALVPDRYGALSNVTLGWPSLEDYVSEHGGTYYGALVGRYGNRIGGGRFSIDGRECSLDLNNAPGGIPCCLHGGLKGFSLRRWKVVEEVRSSDRVGVVMEIESPDGEGGFPGNVKVRTALLLGDDNTWHIRWKAVSDRPTPLSLTDHAYWNLDGVDAGTTVMDHHLFVNSDLVTAYGADMIPTGEFRDVGGTPFDFRTPRRIGERHDWKCDLLEYGAGYDINWVLRRTPGDELAFAAALESSATGRRLEVWTTEPGIQIYDGYYLPSRNTGVALETQHFPDSPNHPEFPDVIVRPGTPFYSATEYRFRTF